MGSYLNIDETKETIIWIDANIYNYENKLTYQKYLPKFKNFNFFRFSSIKEAIIFLSRNEYFEFRLTYVIVSGQLAEEFFNQYVKLSEEKNIVIATSVYCFRQKYHETKPYFKDIFLNTGSISFIFENIVEYILKDECGWGQIKALPYKPEEEKFGNVFVNVDSNKHCEFALPILIGKIINVSLLEKDDIPNFQKILLNRYYEKNNNLTNYLIKPSGNKNMDIPLHLLTKFFLRFYTLEKPKFYRDLNRDLSNDKFDDYRPFIFLLYNGLNKGILKSCNDSDLYRGTALSNIEFQEMKKNFEKTKENKSLKSLFYSKNFLSFSKKRNKAYEFLLSSKYKECTTILFKIQKPKNEKLFLTNIDISSISSFKREEEILFLPLSCFEIINISPEKEYNYVKYFEVTLKYLDDYEEIIKSEIDNIRKDKEAINDFFKKSMDSKFGKDIQKYYNKNDILSVQYSKFVGASPDNNFFLNKIGTGFIHKINKLINSEKNEAQIHIDDEIPNMISEENKIKKFFIDLLKQLDNKMFDQGYSIGICLGNFIYNWESFYNSPNSNKAFNLATLSLAVFLPAIKLIPQIKSLIKKHLFNFCSFGINISTILNGLNILYAAFVEFKYIFSFSHEHKKKQFIIMDIKEELN